MRRALRLLSYFSLGLMLGACHGFSDTISVPAPTQLMLHQPLTIPADRSAVFMQDGKLISFAALNAYAPHCKFELHDPAPQERAVRPDTFAIVGLRQNIYVSQLPPRGTRLASADIPTYFVYATEMRLNSPQQPQVFQLTCQHWEPGDAATPRYDTLDEMQRALGGIATLSRAQPASSLH